MLGTLTPPPARHASNIGAPRRGLTLIELMLTVLITAVLVAIAVPQMRELIARKRLASVANEMVADMRYARSILLDRNQAAWVRFGSDATQWCYILFTDGSGSGDLCDCTAAPKCPVVTNPPIELKTVYVRADSGIALNSTPSALRFAKFAGAPVAVFNAANPVLTAEIQSSLAGRLRISVAGPIRATVCVASGQFNEFPACPP